MIAHCSAARCAERIGFDMPGLSLDDLTNPPGGQSLADIGKRNSPYARQGNYNTSLPFLEEMAFRSWVAQNRVPFNPDASNSDYDMRGFYQALQSGDPRAASSVNPNDQRMHYPDMWKTPLHRTFSAESKYAGPVAPQWTADDKLISPGGRILFDERR